MCLRVCMYVYARANVCDMRQEDKRGKDGTGGLLGRVAKEEKIRDPYAEEEEDNRRGTERGKGQRTTTENILKVDKASRGGREREMKRLVKGERVAC